MRVCLLKQAPLYTFLQPAPWGVASCVSLLFVLNYSLMFVSLFSLLNWHIFHPVKVTYLQWDWIHPKLSLKLVDTFVPCGRMLGTSPSPPTGRSEESCYCSSSGQLQGGARLTFEGARGCVALFLVLICVSLITTGAEHLFMFLFAIWISSCEGLWKTLRSIYLFSIYYVHGIYQGQQVAGLRCFHYSFHARKKKKYSKVYKICRGKKRIFSIIHFKHRRPLGKWFLWDLLKMRTGEGGGYNKMGTELNAVHRAVGGQGWGQDLTRPHNTAVPEEEWQRCAGAEGAS